MTVGGLRSVPPPPPCLYLHHVYVRSQRLRPTSLATNELARLVKGPAGLSQASRRIPERGFRVIKTTTSARHHCPPIIIPISSCPPIGRQWSMHTYFKSGRQKRGAPGHLTIHPSIHREPRFTCCWLAANIISSSVLLRLPADG